MQQAKLSTSDVLEPIGRHLGKDIQESRFVQVGEELASVIEEVMDQTQDLCLRG